MEKSDRKLLEITERILNTLERSEGTYISDIIMPLLRSSLGNLLNGADKERMGKKPDIMGLLKYDEKIAEFMFAECSRIICCNSKKDNDDFGVVGIRVVGTTIRLNVLVRDLGGIPSYFHLDLAEIPLSPRLLYTKALIHLLLTLRNILIVNKSLLIETLEKAETIATNKFIQHGVHYLRNSGSVNPASLRTFFVSIVNPSAIPFTPSVISKIPEVIGSFESIEDKSSCFKHSRTSFNTSSTSIERPVFTELT
ncbi:20202_t:CDS:2 [Cetraspora pellucida]|uniref:20202_t:CDS:1 n=1 Tax=Cetraspora pellucida TaxID=1433469 RepID=A0A9N9NTI9_9GLOM|nr:20202_t:CDS:2 [Cetraspora pellucida]